MSHVCNFFRNLQRVQYWLAHSDKIALQVAEGILHASNLSRNVAKSRGSFYFPCNSQRNNCSCKMGCYTWIFFLHLAKQRLLRCKLQVTLKQASGRKDFVLLFGIRPHTLFHPFINFVFIIQIKVYKLNFLKVYHLEWLLVHFLVCFVLIGQRDYMYFS